MSTAYSAAKALGMNIFKHPCESMCLGCYGAQRMDIIKEHVLAPLIMTTNRQMASSFQRAIGPLTERDGYFGISCKTLEECSILQRDPT